MSAGTYKNHYRRMTSLAGDTERGSACAHNRPARLKRAIRAAAARVPQMPPARIVGPVPSAPATAQPPCEPVPIWLAALIAGGCRATGNGENRLVRWDWIAGRAMYSNDGAGPVSIEALGISLEAGETVAVSWMPGETAYTIEVYTELYQVA